MIKHIVALKIADDCEDETLRAVMQGLADLEIDGFTGFQHGPNIDGENKSADYPYGFICDFDDEVALKKYCADPKHKDLGAALEDLCKGGSDGIVVYDLHITA